MTLYELLKKEMAAIHKSWLARTLESYPEDTAVFLGRQKDRFANPVGHTLDEGIRGILEVLAERKELDGLLPHLESMVKIRSVQGGPPSDALAFLYFPKQIIRERFEAEIKNGSLQGDLEEFEASIDRMTLAAFDIYAFCREKLCDIRVNEVKRMVSQALRRTDFFESDSSSLTDGQEGGER